MTPQWLVLTVKNSNVEHTELIQTSHIVSIRPSPREDTRAIITLDNGTFKVVEESFEAVFRYMTEELP
jgi:hypothetical protein